MSLLGDKILLKQAIFLLFFLSFTGSVFAISLPNTEIGQTLSIAVVPEYPGPKEEVTLTLSSPSFDVNTANISWVLNGSVSAKGVGIKKFTFMMGNVGVRSRIDVVIRPANEAPFSRSFDLYPTNVDLLWQAHSYTPPFYEGKAEHSTEAAVTIAAVPAISVGGNLIPRENLVYQWTHNGRSLGNSSGYGKSKLTIANSFTRTKEVVSVVVSTTDKSIFSKKEIEIPVNKPEIIFYEEHPLFGTLFNRGIVSEATLLGKEVSFSVSPYFFAVNDPASPQLKYEWSINGVLGQAGNSREKLTLRNESGESGQSQVNLKITDPARVISYAERTFLIKFGAQNQ